LSECHFLSGASELPLSFRGAMACVGAHLFNESLFSAGVLLLYSLRSFCSDTSLCGGTMVAFSVLTEHSVELVEVKSFPLLSFYYRIHCFFSLQ